MNRHSIPRHPKHLQTCCTLFTLRTNCRLTIIVIALGLTLTAQTRRKTTPTPPAKPPATHTATHTEDPQLYQNPTFGFRYQIPYGWADRTHQMQEGSET